MALCHDAWPGAPGRRRITHEALAAKPSPQRRRRSSRTWRCSACSQPYQHFHACRHPHVCAAQCPRPSAAATAAESACGGGDHVVVNCRLHHQSGGAGWRRSRPYGDLSIISPQGPAAQCPSPSHAPRRRGDPRELPRQQHGQREGGRRAPAPRPSCALEGSFICARSGMAAPRQVAPRCDEAVWRPERRDRGAVPLMSGLGADHLGVPATAPCGAMARVQGVSVVFGLGAPGLGC